MAYEPEFTGESVAPSSADASYHPVAIQLYGHASKFNGTTTNHVRGDLQMYWSLLHIFASKTSLSELGPAKESQTGRLTMQHTQTYLSQTTPAWTSQHAEYLDVDETHGSTKRLFDSVTHSI